MREDLLHFIWRYRLYDATDMRTTSGEPIHVVQAGSYNTHAGADFSSARIRIGDALMAGNVEIHVHAADWYTHHHDRDAAYNNTILHVVYEGDDKPTLLQNGRHVPILCLHDHISTELLHRYELLKANTDKIACEKMIGSLPAGFSLPSYYDRLVVERLQAKTAIVESMLTASVNDWDQVAFQMVAMYFGASVNKEPFALLARSLPLQVIHKHRDDPRQVEALLFGQAGLLDADCDDEYPKELRREYNYLRKLHALTPIEAHSWRFFRTRPANFPTIKIAQLAALLIGQVHFFNAIANCRSLPALKGLFDVPINPYWHTHYQFDKPAKKVNTSPGHMLTDVVLINAVVPLLFAYGRYKGEEDICDRALELLGGMPAENNTIIRQWAALGINAKAAEIFVRDFLSQRYTREYRNLQREHRA
jgi:hypothetical protein